MEYEGVTHKLIGCAMKIHNNLGYGFQEVIYQRALKIEFVKNNISFEREKEMNIIYDGISIGTRRVDFLIENKIMLEIKAVTQIEDVHLAQIKNYLEVYNLYIGLLINFGSSSLIFKRIYNNKILKS